MNYTVNWFKYRLPGSKEIVAGISPFLLDCLREEGFVISPFNGKDSGILMIPYSFGLFLDDELYPVHSNIPQSTPKADYLKEVEEIANYFKDKSGKTVASRCIKIETEINLNATFAALCQQYPDAFVFMFSTEETGTWIGASPELLLEEDHEGIHTMALAGTRSADESGQWDDKNIEEQQIVTDYIVEQMEKNCDNVVTEPTFTKTAGSVAHICTPIHASKLNVPLTEFLLTLSPTPALCGSDKEESLRLISELEKHDREFYGGFCGPYNINGKTSLYVMVRTAKCSDKSICVYVGGGITKDSKPEDEWEETELKSKTIINSIKTKKK